MHIFIDTNIFLDFYSASADSLVDLAELSLVIRRGEVTLWLPDQVKREFWKNRTEKIEAMVRSFENNHTIGSTPLLVREDPDFGAFDSLAKQLEKKKAELIYKIRTEIAAETTQADKSLRDLFSAAKEIDTSDLYTSAMERSLRHSPPGKDEYIGDRVNWLALLKHVPPSTDLHIISLDSDFAKDERSEEAMPYLKYEWKNKNGGALFLWKRLSKFLAHQFKDAKNAIDAEHALAIKKLAESSGFSTTHRVIAEFPNISHMTDQNITKLASALVDNDQVYWIIDDADVKEFVEQFLLKYSASISDVLKEKIDAVRKKLKASDAT